MANNGGSLEVSPSLDKPPGKTVAQPTPWFQSCEILSRDVSLASFDFYLLKVWGDKWALFQTTKFGDLLHSTGNYYKDRLVIYISQSSILKLY